MNQFSVAVLGWIAALRARSEIRRRATWLAIWSTALLAITCLTTPICLRYLHPFTFMGSAGVALLWTQQPRDGELAEIFLAEELVRMVLAFFFQEFKADAGQVVAGNAVGH